MHGRKESVGRCLRNVSVQVSEEFYGSDTKRQVCESTHHAFKRWLQFDIHSLRKATRKVKTNCRFLFLQLLSTLFSGLSLREN